jgi:peptidoglycan hydrolase-like protein with peptidoglycan-binding domain
VIEASPPRAPAPSPIGTAPQRRRRWPWLVAIGGALALIVAGLVAAVFEWSGASLAKDPSGLARLNVQAFGGSLERVRAFDSRGHPIPVAVRNGRVVPRTRLAPGQRVTVDAVVRRPGSVAWLVGDTTRESITLRTPMAHPRERWLTVARGSRGRIAFDHPVRAIAVGAPGSLHRTEFGRPHGSVAVPSAAAAGTVEVATAARSWEKLGRPRSVTWFPASGAPSVVASPAPAATTSPTAPLRLTFSKPVGEVLGKARPTLSPATPGNWSRPDSHTLVFQPTGYGAPMGATVRATLPRELAVVGADGTTARSETVSWTVPPGSILRLQQLLAQDGYLPVDWQPSGAAVARTPSAQVRAAVDPPAGNFNWRYPNTPSQLRAQWTPAKWGVVTKGALMAFESDHGLTADGVPGPDAWHALLADAISGGGRSSAGYSYVYVSMSLPESLTLWHNGHNVTTTPANTGIAAAPTAAGTYPVFEHLPVGTMSGTNPDGSSYNDPGIRYISYFNGGDAVHAFDRASFGTPQSLGCVELPLAAAAKVYPYMPIGTLVTVE